MTYLYSQNNRMKKQTHTDDDVEDEFTTMEMEVKRAAAELKGKNYAFDHTGRPILINKVNPDSLPPYAYQPGLTVNLDTSSDLTKKQVKKGKKKIRVAGSRSVDHPQFVPTASLATALSSHTSIPLNPGVTLKSGETVREGPLRADDPKKPSRKDFFNKQALSSMSSLELGSESMSWNDKSQVQSSVATGNLSESGKVRTTSSTKGGDRSGGLVPKYRYQDIDPLEGGREIINQSVSTVQIAEDEENAETEASYKRSVPGSHTRPAILQPVKPSEKQREIVGLLHGGPDLAGPRDRLSHQTLESRRKISFAPNSTPIKNSDSSLGNLKQNSVASMGSRSQGGSVKKERADIASEIF